MNKKILISIIIVLATALGIVGWLYLGREDGKLSGESPGEVPEEGELPEGLGHVENGFLVTEDFSVKMPEGWGRATQLPQGIRAMVINVGEEVSDPAAREIDFKTYFAISQGSPHGKSVEEYFQLAKEEIARLDSGVVFLQERETTIDGRKALAVEIEITQEGIDFKVLLVVIEGKNEDIWGLSFNTLKGKWADYLDLFSEVARSFQIK